METNNEQFELSFRYRVISIEDKHKLAIVHLLNTVITESPLLEDIKDTKSVVWRLGSVINYFEKSFISGKFEINIPSTDEISDHVLSDMSVAIRKWLMNYYNAESVIESLKLEDGMQEEIAMASLLILNVFYQLRSSLPQVKALFDLGWIYLSEFDEQLEAMWRTDRAVNLLQTELECERNQRQADKDKVMKLQKELYNIKTKLQQSKATVEKLKKYVEKPGPKSKKKSAITYIPEGRRRGRPKKGGKIEIRYIHSDSDVEPDTPPPPGTPVLLSSSGTGSSCRYCGKWFNEAVKLNRHMAIHAGSKPFACDWPGCGRPFDSNYKLQRHRRCHTGERPFACTACEKRFTRSDKLREHFQRCHTGERPYACDSCDKSFTRSDKLRDHHRTHLKALTDGSLNANDEFEQNSILPVNDDDVVKTQHSSKIERIPDDAMEASLYAVSTITQL